jgi:hypothetical protein
MPYFIHDRMQENCDRGIWNVGGGSGGAEALTSSSLFAGPAIICSTRGLRSVGDGRAVSVTAGLVTGGFDVKSASAAWRALDICSRFVVARVLLSTKQRLCSGWVNAVF